MIYFIGRKKDICLGNAEKRTEMDKADARSFKRKVVRSAFK